MIAWSGTKGKEAAWHAAHYLRFELLTRPPIKNDTVHCSHRLWALYITCLVLYAYSSAASLTRVVLRPGEDDSYEDYLTYLDAVSSSHLLRGSEPAHTDTRLTCAWLVPVDFRRSAPPVRTALALQTSTTASRCASS